MGWPKSLFQFPWKTQTNFLAKVIFSKSGKKGFLKDDAGANALNFLYLGYRSPGKRCSLSTPTHEMEEQK